MVIKKILPALLCFVVMLGVATPVFADTLEGVPYYITNYDVQVNVTEDNILQITENIDVFFNEERHGIYRYIPTFMVVERVDGSTDNVRAKVRNIDCNELYTSSYEINNYVMQIGDEDVTLTGAKHYTISYNYCLGKDVVVGSDELYFNIIGDGWDTSIQNVSFTINMPKEFDENLLGFSVGEYGTAGTDEIEYYVNQNQITGKLTTKLYPYEAFTMRLELPEGYFYFNQTAENIKLALMVMLPAICIVAVVLIWKKYGNDKDVVETVEFYPPNSMSSAKMAYWYKGHVVSTDIVPMLIELANDGCVAIHEDDDTNYVIKSVKRYTGPDENKRIFYDGLFEYGNCVIKDDLKDSFYIHINQIVENLNTIDNRKKVFDGKSLAMRVLCWVIVVACFAINVGIFNASYGLNEKFIAFAIGFVLLAIAFVLSFFVRRRTEKSHQLLGRIEGFKTFLDTAEKEKLETLVHDNPTYYYDILPYAYVLGVSDEWMKKFESIAIEPPKWYRGTIIYDRMWMHRFINNTIHSCNTAMTSAPKTSSGGGGGFAGGGVGGGGGGSW